MKLSDLPDIDFVDIDRDTVQQAVFDAYTNITGRMLAQGDPIRLYNLFITEVIIRLLNKLNDTGKQNLLKYANGGKLDNLAALVRTTRLQSSTATTTLMVTLSAARANETIIPAGTRVASGDNKYFATDEDLIITAGSLTGTVGATCTDTGITGNGYMPGEISLIVDPVAYVASISNTTQSEGGSETETDDAFRARTFEAPESFSTAGPAGAYRYHVMSMNSGIIDVGLGSPQPGTVEIAPLMSGGTPPGEELINEVQEALMKRDVRPLTDYVQVVPPEQITYDVDVTYYIYAEADMTTVQAKVNEAVNKFVLWQKSVLGRDVNPSELHQAIKEIQGVKRVIINQPGFLTVYRGNDAEGNYHPSQVAIASSISVTMGGVEDE